MCNGAFKKAVLYQHQQMDEFNYRMPNDEVTNEGGPKENEKD